MKFSQWIGRACLLVGLSVAGSATPLSATWVDDSGGDHRGQIRRADLDGGKWGTAVVRIYLPPGYKGNPSPRFPVLYACDGQSCFQPGDFGDWEMDETVDDMIGRGALRQMFVVTIDAPNDRTGAYVPRRFYRDLPPSQGGPQEGGGGAAVYLRLVVSIKETVDRDFPTDRNQGAILGSSLGGLFALFASYSRPDQFPRAAVMSPSLWVMARPGNGDLVPLSLLGKGPDRLWLDMGDHEDDPKENVPKKPTFQDLEYVETADWMVKWLKRQAPAGKEIHFEPVEGVSALHNEDAWRARLGQVLQWIWR